MDPIFTKVMIIILSLMSVTIVIINSICMYTMITSKLLLRKTTSALIFSILLLHMIQGLFVLPFYIAKKAGTDDLLSQKIICDGFRLSYMITFYGVCSNVLLISLDRLLAVKLLTAYKSIVTRQRAKFVVCCMWFYIIALCLIPFIDTERSVSNTNSECKYNQQKQWTIFMLITNTLIVYIIVSFSYIYIFLRLYIIDRKLRSNSGEPITTNNNMDSNITELTSNIQLKHTSVQQATKVTFVVVSTYGLTWAPSITYYLMVTLNPTIFTDKYYNSELESYITFFIKFLTFFDAIIAPIIYCYLHRDFRNEFKKCWQGILPKKRQTDIMQLDNID